MLDTETKRKIDSARDILVGKVPDPKAQVEQIEKERAAVDACKTLVALFEAKIKTKIAEVWGVPE